ncbi:Putative exodeoxyribonuclease 8, PDDEXK-like domain containing protein [uncultured Caudovirales phage]|jgi:hypothetical protein|uniref:Exodeoxyribonuclease 8, PDDEXK-like domain containing protein n=2 Tax=uncultured Caudovirales phage TaxID=2100421 RepID=A0A6J5MZD4_9CAUD|nr:Putative exodeoxyribonuclease 8, PDDEXK-like domain containing protein [uncultured Caudovirales phage]CAB4167447.1 Putative exodeoxyribonuclease 8, PDDEXK-like domain containing protein [uncultured Caudovirales phage]CAB4178859.1 Putative exodeoxyribonuclease 8, PDDEXK-like domain containing protein [uncultured Caudovirales phage]CAB4188648.1 Putative exodeoxyribonuclease 8, PDDEXK-like domain containing protein [uncultured Caudovirales phage]CAB4220295.1 Putative exodeoxyribonuclease 8, PDD
MTIIKDGLYDMTNEEYHESEGLSRSALWLYRENQYKYWYKYLSGKYAKDKATKPMAFGSLCHTIVLEPELFKAEYAIKPEIEPLPKAGLLKDLGRTEFEKQKQVRALAEEQRDFVLAKFERESQGRTIISLDDYNKAMKIKESIYSRDMCAKLLSGCIIEKSIFWTDQETGLLCKIRPDAYMPGKYALDLKTEENAGYQSFQRTAMKYGYFLQAGMIWEGLKAIGEPIEKFIDLAVEKEEPYAVATYVMDDEAVQYGIDLFHALLRKYAVSRETNEFNDYGLQVLMAPKYALEEMNYD